MYTEAEDIGGGIIHVTEVQVDDGVHLTREQIAELAARFPVSQGAGHRAAAGKTTAHDPATCWHCQNGRAI